MRFIHSFLALVIIVFNFNAANAQQTDTTTSQALATDTSLHANWQIPLQKQKARHNAFLAPAILGIYGFASLEVGGLKNINAGIKEDVWEDHPHNKTTIDNYLQYSPAMAVYALNALGIKGRNNFRDRSLIYLMSNVFVGVSVIGVKNISHEQRPDGSDFYSFPSGHTATAFAAAEFMRQEYKDLSPWYGIAGYFAAGATGALRMYNNKHWVSDVLAGAGFGIASTKLAYLVYPAIKRKFFKEKPMNTMIMPYYQNKGGGISMVYNFH
ncbi:MAG: phosphatase PAP2 family protein [Ferruginibacter sp.]